MSKASKVKFKIVRKNTIPKSKVGRPVGSKYDFVFNEIKKGRTVQLDATGSIATRLYNLNNNRYNKIAKICKRDDKIYVTAR